MTPCANPIGSTRYTYKELHRQAARQRAEEARKLTPSYCAGTHYEDGSKSCPECKGARMNVFAGPCPVCC